MTQHHANNNFPHICYEREIPAEHHLEPRSSTPGMRESYPEDNLPPVVRDADRMAIEPAKVWPRGKRLRCRFLHGDTELCEKVAHYARTWMEHANIHFDFVTSGDAEIRISFVLGNGSWSAVGTDALNTAYFPANQPTMNFGWLTEKTAEDEFSQVVLHEFGHALGCVHEHSSPNYGRTWDVEAVMRYFSGPPNFWDPEKIQQNVLKKYGDEVEATRYDEHSIMLYMFDRGLFTDGKGPTNKNTKLSEKDIEMIKRFYLKV